MKLYYVPGACAMACHIAACEAELPLELSLVSFGADGRSADGGDYYAINPKGAVPALAVDGEILTEAAVILQYLASLAPAALPIPAEGMAKWHFLERLHFMATDVHKAFSPLFAPGLPEDAKPALLGVAGAKYALLESTLGDRPYFGGDSFTILDAYGFLLCQWTGFFGLDIDEWPKLKAYRDRLISRPSIQQALKEEGLA